MTEDGGNADILVNQANAYRDAGRMDDALASYGKALAIRPDDAGTLHNLGFTLGAMKRPADAEAAYRRALELTPSSADLHMALGLALKDQDRLEDAVGSYRQAIQLRPGLAKAHANLAVALQKQRKLGAARAAYGRALDLNPAFRRQITLNLASTGTGMLWLKPARMVKELVAGDEDTKGP